MAHREPCGQCVYAWVTLTCPALSCGYNHSDSYQCTSICSLQKHDVQCFPVDGNKQLSTTGIITLLFVGLLDVRRPPRLVFITSLACTHAYRLIRAICLAGLGLCFAIVLVMTTCTSRSIAITRAETPPFIDLRLAHSNGTWHSRLCTQCICASNLAERMCIWRCIGTK